MEFQGYEFFIEGAPDYALLTVKLPANETVKVEAAAMAAMDTNLKMKTKMGGGFKRFLSGESLFINEFTAQGAGGEIKIAPPSPGDVQHVYLDGQTPVYLQNSAYVASSPSVELDTKFAGLKGFFSGTGLFLVNCKGTGDLWFSSYGALIEIDIDGDYVIDNNHIVAFTGDLDYKVTPLGGMKSFFFSGEALVCKFSGKGKVWVQSRAVAPLLSWVYPFRPASKD